MPPLSLRFAVLAAVITSCTAGFGGRGDQSPPPAWSPGPVTNERTDDGAPGRANGFGLRMVELFEDGERSTVDTPPGEAVALDLSDDWVPLPLTGSASGQAPSYRADYLAAARDPEQNLAVYGILPTPSVIRERLGQTARHRCHDTIRDGSLVEVEGTLVGWRAHREAQRRKRDRVDRLRRELEEHMTARSAANDSDDAKAHAEAIALIRADLVDLEPEVLAIREAQAHLRCDGLLDDNAEDAVLDRHTRRALEQFQARNGLLPTQRLDSDTRATMRRDSRELDFLVLLRVLRERVAAAAGLLADGSAAGEREQVLGYYLDGEKLRTRPDDHRLPNPAPDRISRATEQAALALGWTGPRQALEHLRDLDANPPSGPVAVELSDLPGTPNAPLQIRAVIDRGDVYYDFPYTDDGERRRQPMDELPSLTIYATRNGVEEAVAHWPTTIGMWAREQNGQRVSMRYEESPVGPRVWRDMIVAPRWLPPRGIPDSSLMTRKSGEWQADYETVGPGPSSAYGLVMLVHHKALDPEADNPRYRDEGIRTHGTGNLRSIVEEHQGSHGCHRTFNINMLRLTAFLLRHRQHIHHGEVDVGYSRRLRDGGRSAQLRIDSRGYRIELDPPVPVEVLRGDIRGEREEPIAGLRPLPAQLRARLEAAEEEEQEDESEGEAD